MSTGTRTGGRIAATFTVEDGGMRINGRPIFGRDQAALLSEIDRLAALGRPSLVVTLNVDQTLNFESDPAFREAVLAADLVVIDGTPIAWLGKALGATEVARNTGADLLPAVASNAAARNWSIAVTGGRDAVIDQAVANLSSRSTASIVGVSFPMIASADDSAATPTVNALQAARPSVVFLCLGSPKQELWFEAWKERLPPAVHIGAGAAVDFAAGTVARAPSWMQRSGLEWLFRLGQEPKRLAQRYLVRGPRFLIVIARSITARRRRPSV